ncbi:MAG: hypothetical protein IJ070_01160 [Firmicutes bacterium]|nr:hypothetical protein [Bacillota bacterium]
MKMKGQWVPCNERLPDINGTYHVLRVMPSGRLSETKLLFSMAHADGNAGCYVSDRWINNRGKVLTTVTEWFEPDKEAALLPKKAVELREAAYQFIVDELEEGIERSPVSGVSADELYWRALGSLHMLKFLDIADAANNGLLRLTLIDILLNRIN